MESVEPNEDDKNAIKKTVEKLLLNNIKDIEKEDKKDVKNA